MRLLIIDDDTELCQLVADYLRPMGFEVEADHAGIPGARRALDEAWHAIILDVMMPEMDGYTLTAEIRNDPRMQKLHIILHTSLSGVFNQAMVKKVGADDFLAKFRPDDLASRVVDRIKAADHG